MNFLLSENNTQCNKRTWGKHSISSLPCHALLSLLLFYCMSETCNVHHRPQPSHVYAEGLYPVCCSVFCQLVTVELTALVFPNQSPSGIMPLANLCVPEYVCADLCNLVCVCCCMYVVYVEETNRCIVCI